MKKYFKYILLTFILMLGFNVEVKATNCQYELNLDNTYFTINFEYDTKFTNNMKYYYCISNEKVTKICKDNQASIYMFQLTNEKLKDYWIMAENASAGYYDLSEGFRDGQCPKLSMKYDIDGDYDGYIYFDIKGAENPNDGGGTVKYVSAIEKYSSASSKDADQQIVYKYDDTTISLITKSDGQKKLKIENDGASKTCDVKEEKDVKCIKDDVVYFVNRNEVKDLWNETSFAYLIELETDYYYITKYSTYEEAVEEYGKYSVIEYEKNNSGTKMLYLSDICDENTEVMKVVRFIGYLLVIVKILIPLGLIIFGIINFSKAMIAGNEDAIKKNAYNFVWKIVFAIIIFVLPTIINFIFGLIDGATDGTEDYENCRICIFDPKKCEIP